MTVPLDRLYTHLDNLCNRDNVIISRWHPHGSKKASDLHLLKDYSGLLHRKNQIQVIFHDQEPLDFGFYTADDIMNTLKIRGMPDQLVSDVDLRELLSSFHLRALAGQPLSQCDQTILVHSELNSPQVSTYAKHDFVPVYWWAHGIIAQDWFRYAQLDSNTVDYPTQFEKTFLVYCRAWSGTRQYRLQFLQGIKNSLLHEDCQVNFGAWDNGQHYSDVCQDHTLEQCFASNTAPSSASADYSTNDYHRCAIELVLETVYEPNRIHLTEKTCRPLACGKPFVLASGPGSLQTLRNYGFETFAPWINENYDLENDVDRRRAMIIEEMQRLNAVPKNSKLWSELHKIAARNREKFHSKEFTHKLFSEFKDNFEVACKSITSSNKYVNLTKNYIDTSQCPEVVIEYLGYRASFCQ